jgi:dolichol kinase
LLTLAFNSVTALLILIESARYFELLPEHVSKWFKFYCNGFERRRETMIITHIYLLIGVSFPFISTYILIGGGVFPPNWALYSLSGAIFLGIGDSAAAICGKWWGK